MDAVIPFIREFIRAEFEARRAMFTENDDAVFAACVQAADRFFDSRAGGTDIGRPPGLSEAAKDPDSLEAAALDELRLRTLFIVRQYHVTEYGDLFRGYVSSGMKARKSRYFHSLFVARSAIGLAIIGRWGICVTCWGSGTVDDRPCPTCVGSGWEPAGGMQIGQLGPVLDTRRLEAPTHPLSLADYNQS